jgi:hypothetical protein
VFTRVVSLRAGEPFFRIHNELELAVPISPEHCWERHAVTVNDKRLGEFSADESVAGIPWRFDG